MIPRDKYHLAYLNFFIQGIGQLLPWNAFISSPAYFSQRFCGTPHARDFSNYFSLTFMTSNLVFQALLVRHVKAASKHSMRRRILWPLAFLLVLFTATALLVLWKDVPREGLFAFTNLCVALCGLCTALLQAAIFGYAAVFPPRFTQAMMAGQGLAGLMVAFAGLATAASTRANDACDGSVVAVTAIGGGGGSGDVDAPSSPSSASPLSAATSLAETPDAPLCTGYEEVDYHAFAYFATAIFVLGVCMVSFLWLEALPFAQHYTKGLVVGGGGVNGSSSAAAVGEREREVEKERYEAAVAVAAAVSEGEGEGEGEEQEIVRGDSLLLEVGGREGEPQNGSSSHTLALQEVNGNNDGGEEEESDEEEDEEEEDPTSSLQDYHHRHSNSSLYNNNKQEFPTSPLPAPPSSSPTHPHTHSHIHTHHHPPAHPPFLTLLRTLGSPGAGVFLVFFVTLALFPSTTVHIVSTRRCEGKGIFYDHAFVPFQFVLFNLFDFLGRSAAGHLPPRFILPPAQLWVWAAARVVFVPLFLLCNVEGSAFPVYFPSDWWPSVFMVLFALSNGYLSSLSMMFGPAQLEHAHLAEMGGNVMVLLMTCGLSGGSLLSFLVSAVSLGKL